MYISTTDINCIINRYSETPYYLYITHIGDDYFLVHVYTPCDCPEEVYKEFVITDIISPYDEYLRIVSEI